MQREKQISKEYYLGEKTVDYVIEPLPKSVGTSLEDLVSTFQESIIVVDTEDILFRSNIELFDQIDETDKVLIALVSKQILGELQKGNFRQGFIRATNERFDSALVIVDKKDCYLFGNDKYGIQIDEKYNAELFKIVNHLIWAKSDYELCQGAFRAVKETKLSVVLPPLKGKELSALKMDDSVCTVSLNPRDTAIVTKYNEIKKYKSGLIADNHIVGFIANDVFYARLYNDCFYPLTAYKPLFNESFRTNIAYKDLMNRMIRLIDGEMTSVAPDDLLIENASIPFDKYLKDDFSEINLDSYEENYKKMVVNLTVSVKVTPITIDDSYKKHENYKNYDRLEKRFTEEFDKVRKILENNNKAKKAKKKMALIESEPLLFNKIVLYNKLIEEYQVGIGVLNNKQAGFRPLYFDKRTNSIPQEIIGVLFTKKGTTYFGTNEEHFKEAVQWLKENEIEAVMAYYER